MSLLLALMSLSTLALQVSSPQPQAVPFEKVAGTFELAGKSWTVVLRGKRVANVNDAALTSPDGWVQSFEIQDASHLTVFKNHDLATGEVSASAELVEGQTGKGIVVSWGFETDAPGSCRWYQFFTVLQDRLLPLGVPICEVLEFAATKDKMTLKYDEKGHFDYFDTINHVEFYDVIVPIRVSFLDARLMGGRLELIPHQPRGSWCAFPVRAETGQRRDRDSFVRLFSQADRPDAPQHVVVKPDSQIQFLSAAGRCTLDDYHQPMGIDLRDRPWLQISIDGQTGWIHDEEDLIAVGLGTSD